MHTAPYGKVRRVLVPCLAWAASAVAVLAVSAGQVAADSYTITDLGTMGGLASSAAAINHRGQVVGAVFPTGDRLTARAFLWQSGVMTDLGSLGGRVTRALAINDEGQIAGYSYLMDSTTPHAVLWQNGVMRDLGTLGGSSSAALGIDAAGEVVGLSQTAGDNAWHPFFWKDGMMIDLEPQRSGSSRGRGINSRGQVIGDFDAEDGYHAFLWQAGSMRDLGTLGGTESWPSAINAQGQVVGFSSSAAGHHSPHHAFLYDGAGMHDLGTLEGDQSSAFGINDGGQVVGASDGHAFLWAGVMKDLNDMTPRDSGWVLTRASQINQDGQIVGEGVIRGETHAFLMTLHALAAPDHLIGSPISNARIALSWTDNSSNETQFAVWRIGNFSDWVRVGVVPPNTTHFTDIGVSPSTVYAYRVRATNDTLASAWSNETIVGTPAQPGTPVGLSALPGSKQIHLSWGGSSRLATAVEVYRKSSSESYRLIAVLSPDSTGFTDEGLSADAIYCYRVRAANDYFASPWSSEVTATAKG